MLRMPHARAPALSSAHSRADQTQQQQTPAMSHEWQGAGASGSAPAPEASRAVPVTCSPRCAGSAGGRRRAARVSALAPWVSQVSGGEAVYAGAVHEFKFL